MLHLVLYPTQLLKQNVGKMFIRFYSGPQLDGFSLSDPSRDVLAIFLAEEENSSGRPFDVGRFHGDDS